MLAKVANCLANHLKTFLLYYNIANINHISYNKYFLKNIVLSHSLTYKVSKQYTRNNKILICIMHRQWYKFLETSLLQLYIYTKNIYKYIRLERRHVLKSTYLKSPIHDGSQLSKPMSLEPS